MFILVTKCLIQNQFILNPNPPQINQGNETELSENPLGRFKNPVKNIPPKFIIGILLLILVTIVGFTVNEVFFNRITSLSLVPDDTEYYLTLSIKDHPQAKKAKQLVERLPGGERILESLDRYSTELLGKTRYF